MKLREDRRRHGACLTWVLLLMVSPLLSVAGIADAAYEFRFNPPDGTTCKRKAETKVTEWQVFNAERISLSDGRRVDYGAYSWRRTVGWQTESFAHLARTPDRDKRDHMTNIRWHYRSEIGEIFYVEPPGKREWKNKHRCILTIRSSDTAITITSTPYEVEMQEVSRHLPAAVEQATKWDQITLTSDTLGRLLSLERADATPPDPDKPLPSDVPGPFADVGDAEIHDELCAAWGRRCGQWVGRSAAVGDMFCRIDTIIVAGTEVCSLRTYCLAKIEDIKRKDGKDCLRVVTAYDTDPAALDSVMGVSFWDVYEGDAGPEVLRDDIIVLGHDEVLVDPATLLIHEEKSMRRLSFLKDHELPRRSGEKTLIHIVEEQEKIEYTYEK
ncbi:MAG TPA: hypothetical protein VM118_03615 [Acidobacteriota bacterium]|nr:hypothetical protein [Acidobacteriota bacterium]